MFIKVTRSKNYYYLQLVRSYREDNIIKHKVIANLGRFDQLKNNEQITLWGKRLLEIAGQETNSLSDLQELNRLTYGDIVYKKLWDKYDFCKFFKRIIKPRKIKYDFWQTVYLLVIDRLLQPGSKLACYQRQGKYLNIESIALHHIYRSLDVLAELKELIEEHIFNKHRNLFNMNVDVVFYDVTTYHFESVCSDELKDFGFSKAGKFNEVQVVMGLLIDMEGHPVGYNLFEGNTFEGKTLLKALDTLKQRYSIRRLIIVADKGLNSKENLYNIKETGYEYIVSSRIKNSSSKIQQAIFCKEGYKHIKKDKQDEHSTFRYKVIEDHAIIYKNEQGTKYQWQDKLIITWSSKRAQRDKQQRDRQIKKAQKMLDSNKKPNTKKGHQRFIATEGEQKVIGLDEEKIKAEALWDGYYGIETNQTNMNASEIIDVYHQLWKIEESFRVLKSTMRTRPIFHWTPKRIEGHFVVCFIAFVLERALESKLKSNNVICSPEKIKEAINSLEVSEIALGEQRYYLRSKHHSLASKILNTFKIKHINNLTPKEDFPVDLSTEA